ncbi:MAG: hypothetical protein AAGH70_04655 [Pseudomonadota bacterium]
MTPKHSFAGLLLTGAGPRLAVAFAIIILLWSGYFWATGTPGALLWASE